MTRNHVFSGLRERLAARLSKVIGNPAIERKELAAFDIVVGRREVLHGTGLAAVTALVAAGTPPTMWGRQDPELAVAPAEVGLTQAEQASVTAAVGLSVGSETFQDTVYAQQVVSAEAVNTHAVVEGARGQLRLQSDLTSEDPEESAFLDTDYHFGPPELIQLEQVSGGWELVHYYHPWGARSDGARTDGLERAVVIPVGTLVSPTKVLTITGTYTNRFVAGSGAQNSQIAYLAFVEDAGIENFKGGLVCVGTGVVAVEPPYSATGTYPVKWEIVSITDIMGDNTADVGPYNFCDKYTAAAFNSAASYEPVQATEHIILNYTSTNDGFLSNWVLCLVDTGEPGRVELLSFGLADPALGPGVKPADPLSIGWRLVHMDWDPTEPGGDGYYLPQSVMLATTFQDSDSKPYIASQVYVPDNADTSSGEGVYDSFTVRQAVFLRTANQDSPEVSYVVVGSEVAAFDFSTVHDVHTLFSIQVDVWEPGLIHVSMARFDSATVAVFAIFPDSAEATRPFYRILGLCPMVMPDAAGVGVLTTLEGGVSKFGGFRFVASDEDGNVFVLRQQRLRGTGVAYPPPVYGQYDANGSPRTDWNSTGYDPIPTGTANASILNQLRSYVDSIEAAPPNNVPYNLLLSTLVAFGTTTTATSPSTNTTQGTWLGSEFKAAYALSRFGYDSEHVVVKAAQDGVSGDFASYTMFCNPLTKVWHQRLIAQQVLPQPPGLNETGDHFQATVTPINAYGHPVTVTGNPDYAIEVRADVPTQVIDETHNLYYDVNQYSSFTGRPDQVAGNLVLLVKAEAFAQALYLRPVFTSGLQPSGTDASLLKSVAETTFPWMSVNISAQAQQRMGNPVPADQAGSTLPDTTTYVSTDVLTASNTSTPWDFKGGYNPSSSNLGDVASYMNTSGQNMLSVAAQTTGTYADGTPVNPLSGLNAVPSGSLTIGTTTFGYSNGTVTHSTSAPSSSPAALGGIWSGVSHALHDALHWLRHIEGAVYKDLANGAVAVAIATENITATVSADIMKQVNGIDQALEQVVSTIEEYANIVLNVLVTIVEDSWFYQMIELLIALISLFIYIEDVLKLSSSLQKQFETVLTNGSIPTTPSVSTSTLAEQFLGTGNDTQAALGGLDTSDVATTIEQGLSDLVRANPFTKKILNKVMSEVSQLLSGAVSDLPLTFQLDSTTALQSLVNDFEDLTEDLIEGFEEMTEDVATDLVTDVAQYLENPKQAYEQLPKNLAALTEQIAADALDPLFTFADSLGATLPDVAQDVLDQSGYITMKIPGLADLCKLFGIGDTSGNDLRLSAKDALFFPLATMIWVTVYMQDGKSINSVSDLGADSSTQGTQALGSGAPGAFGTSLSPRALGSRASNQAMPAQVGGTDERWQRASIIVDLLVGNIGGLVWAGTAGEDASKSPVQTATAVGAWFNAISWVDDTAHTFSFPSQIDPADAILLVARTTMALADVFLTVPGAGRDTGAGWPTDPTPTDVTESINAVLELLSLIYDTDQVASGSPNGWDITSIVGYDVYGLQILTQFLDNIFDLESAYEYILPIVLISPDFLALPLLALGKGTEATEPPDEGEPEEPGTPSNPSNPSNPN